MTDPTGTGVRLTLAYHERTKHHLHRYARRQGQLDQATQPDRFRTFAGALAVELPLLAHELATLYGDLYVPGAIVSRALGRDAVVDTEGPNASRAGSVGNVDPNVVG